MKKIYPLLMVLFLFSSCSLIKSNENSNLVEPETLSTNKDTYNDDTNNELVDSEISSNNENIGSGNTNILEERYNNEKKLYGETLENILDKSETLISQENQEETFERGDIHRFIVFCKGLIDLDIQNKTNFIKYMGKETSLLYDYLKNTDFSIENNDDIKSFLEKNDIDETEVDMILYLEGKITKQSLISKYEETIKNRPKDDKGFNFLYLQSLIYVFNNNLSKSKCDKIVLDSGIKLN